MDTCRVAKNLRCLTRRTKQHSAFLLQLSYCKQASFSLFSVMCFAFVCFFVVLLLFKMAPKRRAEALAGVPKQKEDIDVPY